MHAQVTTQLNREFESALTGTFQVSLTRAAIPFRDQGARGVPGGRIGDIGLGVVIDGSDPARADVVDLGSAELRVADLTGPLVVLGWLYPSGLRTLQRVIEDTPPEDRERSRAFSFGMALKVLERAGFSPLTRPTFLRIGYRDLAHDLDLHEGTAVRLLLPSGGVARVHLDYESVTLIIRTGRASRSPDLESAILDAFPGQELFRGSTRDAAGTSAYQLPLPVPRSILEARTLLKRVRRGVTHLLARFEADRYRAVQELTRTFGERDSLHALRDDPGVPRFERVTPTVPTGRVPGGIH